MTFQRILCPTDFSAGAQQAMRTAVRLAQESGAELVLVHAWHLPASAYAGEAIYSATLTQEMMDDAERMLARACDEAKAAGAARVSSKLLIGLPWHAIVEHLEAPTFDLVVIGSHGRTGLMRVLLGSVAEKVVRHAPCPVLVVHPDREPRAFTHVLCPVDFSKGAHLAMALAAKVVRPGGAGIELFHSIEVPVAYSGDPHVPGFMTALDQRSAALLEQWAAELRGKVNVPVTTRSRIGPPGQQTLAILDEEPGIELVVVGSRGHTGLKRALLGSVAEKVVRHARCPVLVAHQRE